MDLSLPLNAVLPLCIYIAIGAVSRRTGFLDERTCSRLNTFCYRILFPVTMFNNILNASEAFGSGAMGPAAASIALLLAWFGLLWLLIPRFVKDRPKAASAIQAGFRGNAVLFALSLVKDLCGDQGGTAASVCVSLCVPAFNILAVILFETMTGGRAGAKKVLLSIITNPLIIGAAAGAAFSLLGLSLPAFAMTAVKSISSMVTPLALIALGGLLRLDSVRDDLPLLACMSAAKLIIAPLLAVLTARALGYSGAYLVTMFAVFGVPAAVSSPSTAQELGGDVQFSSNALALTTVLSMFTLFVWIAILSHMGAV